MKKFLIFLGLCLFVTGCSGNNIREVASLDEFDKSASMEGFKVIDNKVSYQNASYVIEAKLATYEDAEIEMIKYSNSDYAIQVQEQQIDSFSFLKSTGAHIKKEKGNNYYDYTLVSNGRYMVSTRIDNTLIFSKSMLKDKEVIEKIINGLGY